jgi:integrase
VRKTLTIDDDIAVLVEQEQRRTGESFKSTVNGLLRLGIMNSRQSAAKKPFEIIPRPMGLPPGLSYDCIPELLDKLDGPYHR